MITIHTLTQYHNPRWLVECMNSVPNGIEHAIIHDHDDFRDGRWNALHLDRYVAAVDDDDRVRAGAIEACVEALEETGAGIAFTYEARINALGDLMQDEPFQPTLRDVAMHPNALHHLAVIRSECLHASIYEHSLRFHQGAIDWLSKAYVALKHGAVQVPMIGYDWRIHRDSMSKLPEEKAGMEKHLESIRAVTKSWLKTDAKIPQYKPGV